MKALCSCLVIVLCLGLFACSSRGQGVAKNELFPFSYNRDGKLSSVSLVQAIVAALNSDLPAQRIYESFNAKHLRNLSADEFCRYIEALRPQKSIRIESIDRLGEEAEFELRLEIDQRMPLLMDGTEHSIFFYLNYVDSESDLGQMLLAVQLTDEGEPYLDGDWVRAILRLHDFSELYFTAIDEGDEAALSWLLANGKQDFREGDPFVLSAKKAKQLIQYYKRKIIGGASKSSCDYLLPGRAKFSQKYQINQVLTGERQLEIREEKGILNIHEQLTEPLRSVDRNLYVQDERVLPTTYSGSLHFYRSEELSKKLGSLRRVYYDNPDNTREFKAEYLGICFTVDGEYDHKSRTWSGEITEIDVSSPRFRFGPDLKVGLSAYDFFLIYPFAPESNYTMESSFLRGTLAMTVQIEDDKIVRLIWQYR